MSRYKYGLCTWFFPSVEPSFLGICKDIGCDGIQLGDFGGEEKNFPLCNCKIANTYADAVAKTGVEVQSINMMTAMRVGLIRSQQNSDSQKVWELSVRKAAEAAIIVGCSTIMIAAYGQSAIQNGYDYRNVIENLRIGKEIAGEYGVELLFESFSNIEDTIDICKKSGVNLLYDTLNPLKFGFGLSGADEIRAYGTELIKGIHVKDAAADFSTDVMFGEGIGLISECAVALNEIGYSGWIFSEHGYYFKNETSKTAAWNLMEKDLERMREIFK